MLIKQNCVYIKKKLHYSTSFLVPKKIKTKNLALKRFAKKMI